MGALRFEFRGRTHEGDVRVARCLVREGAGQRYHLGMEFLRTQHLTAGSLRLAIEQLIHYQEAGIQTGGELTALEKQESRAPPAWLSDS